jgi:protocatechuate 3,4-dioxygenase beta subunit
VTVSQPSHPDHADHANQPEQHRVSRRAALRTWAFQAAPLVLLAACTGPSTLVGRAQAAPSQPDRAQSESAQSASSTRASAQSSSAQSSAVQQSLPACVLTPEQTEGPYFVDERMNRSDIRADGIDGPVRDGAPLTLTLQVNQVAGSSCAPLAGTYVDVWHCDAQGVYSDVKDNNWGSSTGSTFLRGYQVTDENGLVRFQTIFPGWYRGRAVHIHFKVRKSLDDSRAHEMTSQLYFDDALIDQIHAQPPYAAKGLRDLRNSQDGIFRNGGDKLIVPVTQDGEGYAGTFNLGVQLS